MIVWLGPVLALVALTWPAWAAEPVGVRFSCDEAVSSDMLTEVTGDGEFRLTSGGTVRLADVRMVAGGRASLPVTAWLRSLANSKVRLRAVAPPDRWGRIAAQLELTDDAGAIDVGELLVSEGLAVVDPGQRDVLCRPELLSREDRARRERLGLWRDAGWPIEASALDDIERAAGAFAVVQGRVVSVGERRERTYLNFGRDWARDFNVTIPRRSWADLKARGITAETLRGRTVRVRGLVEKRGAPTLDLVVPDMLEVVGTRSIRSGGK